MSDRSGDTSRSLTEVRTVLSRAETALHSVMNVEDDPDSADMVLALQDVVNILNRWRGKRKSMGSRYYYG